MGWRFRRRVKVLPGVRVNFGKKGISWSFGGRGYTVNVSERGVTRTIGLPGTGFSHTEKISPPAGRHAATVMAPTSDRPLRRVEGGGLWSAISRLFTRQPKALTASSLNENRQVFPREMRPSLFERSASLEPVPSILAEDGSVPREMSPTLFQERPKGVEQREGWNLGTGGTAFPVNVVGESEHQRELKALRDSGLRADGTFLAVLIPPAVNSYDDAIQIRANGGGILGYLSKRDAVAYREVFALAALHKKVGTCQGRLVGGVVDRSIGVILDLKDSIRLLQDVKETLGDTATAAAPPGGSRLL